MNASAPADPPGYAGRIPVRNLWLLMLYASDYFRMRGRDLVDREGLPDDLPDIVAEILARAVERRLHRGLSRAYEPRRAVLDRVRGSIDILATESGQLLCRGKIACRYEELTVDRPRNRYVRGALDEIATVARNAVLAARCRRLARSLLEVGVAGAVPSDRLLDADRFGRHDTDDRAMVAAARLAFELALPTEAPGARFLPLPYRDPAYLRLLFERAVYGFYDAVLSPRGWVVSRSRTLRWPVAEHTPGLLDILPVMRTDIELSYDDDARRIVIDTKFTDVTSPTQFRETVKSGHLYQIYGYVSSQQDDPNAPTEGVLLHPVIGEPVDEAARIQGLLFRFATVNLAGTPAAFRADLLRIVDSQPVPLIAADAI